MLYKNLFLSSTFFSELFHFFITHKNINNCLEVKMIEKKEYKYMKINTLNQILNERH